MIESHQFPHNRHPLHLLDDLLASLSPGDVATAPSDRVQDHSAGSSPNAVEADAALARAEAKQDMVLKAAGELFGNNSSLLENALTLLDEQEQYLKDRCNKTNPKTVPVVRKIRASRSGREAILVRKQRKNPSSGRKSKGNSLSQINVDEKEENKQDIIVDHYYLCLLGRDQIERRSIFTANQTWSRVYRQGAHCTCRSFFQNTKGSSRSSSSSSKSCEATSIPNCSNVVVCKHLLAATLMPHLLPWSKSGGVEVEVVDDKVFAKLIMRSSIG